MRSIFSLNAKSDFRRHSWCSDFGPGNCQGELQPKIFDRGFEAWRCRQKRSAGLASACSFVKRIIENHGGRHFGGKRARRRFASGVFVELPIT